MRCAAFRDALQRGDRQQALGLYREALLPGFFLGDAPEFEEWLETERAHLRRSALDAAVQLAEDAEAQGRVSEGVSAARRVLGLDPYSEVALQQLMRMLEASGRSAEALRAYDEFAARLHADLELSPSAQAQELAAAVRSRAAHASRTGITGEREALSGVGARKERGSCRSAARPPLGTKPRALQSAMREARLRTAPA